MLRDFEVICPEPIVFCLEVRRIRLLATTQRQPLRLTGVEAKKEEGGDLFLASTEKDDGIIIGSAG